MQALSNAGSSLAFVEPMRRTMWYLGESNSSMASNTVEVISPTFSRVHAGRTQLRSIKVSKLTYDEGTSATMERCRCSGQEHASSSAESGVAED